MRVQGSRGWHQGVWGVQAALPAVDLDGTAVAIAVGGYHTCALLVRAISMVEGWLWNREVGFASLLWRKEMRNSRLCVWCDSVLGAESWCGVLDAG
jgi:hypothetical protein